MVIKYLRETGIIGFTPISVKLFLFSVTLSIIWMNQFTFRCKKKIVSIHFVNRPKDKKLSKELKRKKTQVVTYCTLVS